jgi:hypothetical protein
MPIKKAKKDRNPLLGASSIQALLRSSATTTNDKSGDLRRGCHEAGGPLVRRRWMPAARLRQAFAPSA